MALVFFFLLLSLSGLVAQEVIRLEPAEFKSLIEQNAFAAVIDVRTRAEFEAGHIENATLIESLNRYQSSSEVSTPADLAGCEYCDLALYCTSGGRAQTSIGILQEAGFKGTLYNGLGVSQWTNAGFELVASAESVTPSCTVDASSSPQCTLSELPEPGNETISTSRSNQLSPCPLVELLLILAGVFSI